MATSQETFQAIIKTVDESSTALRAISRQVQALTKSTGLAETQINRLDRPKIWSLLGGNVRAVEGHFTRLGSTVSSVHGRISALVPALGALAGVSSIKGIFDLVDKVAERRTEQLKRMDRVGGDPAWMLTAAAKLSFVEVDQLDTGLLKLQQNIVKASQGKAPEVASLFKHLKIDLRDPLTGAFRDVGDMMPQLADAIERTSSPAMRTRMLRAIFGKTGSELAPLLIQGGEEMRRIAEMSRGAGYSFTKEDDANLIAYRREMVILQTAVTGTMNAIGTKLTPVLLPVIRELRLWLTNPANRKWLVEGIDSNVRDVLKIFQDTNWAAIGGDLQWVGRQLRTVIDAVGGLGRALELLLAYKVGKWAIGIGADLLSIATSARAASAALAGVETAAISAGSAGAFAPLLARLGTLAARLAIGTFLYFMWPTETAGPQLDEVPRPKRPGPSGRRDDWSDDVPGINSKTLSRMVYDQRNDPRWDWRSRPGWTWYGTGGASPLPGLQPGPMFVPLLETRIRLPPWAPAGGSARNPAVPLPPGGIRPQPPPATGPWSSWLSGEMGSLPRPGVGGLGMSGALPVRIDNQSKTPLPVRIDPGTMAPLPVRVDSLPPGQPPEGTIQVKIDFSNLPTDGRVSVASSQRGVSLRPQVSVGYTSPMPRYN